MEHVHVWKLKEQITMFAHTSLNIYSCKCGEEKRTYENPVLDETEEEEFFRIYNRANKNT